MKRLSTLLFVFFSVQVFAQTYPITGINISLPANPDASTANWGSGTSLFMITANAKAVNGRVDAIVEESRILVSIKQSGGPVLRSYTSNTAPSANFSTLTKVWGGANAAALLGQLSILAPGDYELCVQFFGHSYGKTSPLSDEKTKAFTIRGNEQQAYQPPQTIAPANGTVFSETGIQKPMTFRWTPVIPRPQEPVSYRLKVWQLMQGQTGMQAMKANQPIITKDAENITQAIISNLISGPCKPPYLCEFIWNVQALNRKGKPIGGNDGMSEAFRFRIEGHPGKLTLVSPANGETVPSGQQLKFTWLPPMPTPSGPITYKIKIVEIKGDQSPEEAMRTNKPHFEKDSLKPQSFQYLSSAPSIINGKKYAWMVTTGEMQSAVSIFDRWGLKTTPAGNPQDSTVTTNGNPPAPPDTGSAAVGDTIRAGLNGEFKVAVKQATKETDGSLTGNGTVTVDWLSSNIAVEFKKIRIDSTKRLTAGGIITVQGAGPSYLKAWLISNATAAAATVPLDGIISYSNNQVDNIVNWINNDVHVGQPIINYQSNIPPPPIPANSLKMPFGVKFNTDDFLMVTEIIFKPNESKVNFLAQKLFTKGVTDYKLGFSGKYFKIHPHHIEFSNGRVDLVEDINVPNLASDPKMKFTFKKGAPASGCYIEWDSTGVKDVGLGLDVKFSRDWLLPDPTSPDSVKATISGNGTSLKDILLRGTLANCEIVGTSGMKIHTDSIFLDLSDLRNPSSMHFPANYTSDTTAQGKLLWQGFYVKTFGLTLPDTWKTGANPTQITASNTIIDDFGVTMKVKATNIITFPQGRVSDMSASLDTLELSLLKGSLTDGNAKGKLVLPLSRDTITNTLKYKATFAQVGGANNFQIVVVPTGPIDADIIKGKMTLSQTSNIIASLSANLKTVAINLNGSMDWGDKDLSVTDTTTTTGGAPVRKKGIKGIKMEMAFENLSLAYASNSVANTNTLSVNPGTWSFASPQKRLANFPVSIKKVYYKSLTTVTPSNSNLKELVRGALMIDIVANLTDDIGGTTTVGAAFAVELNTSAKKFIPKFKGVFIEDIAVHADMPAVKIDGKLKMYNHDPTYGDGFLATLGVTFTAVSIQANALVQFGNTTWNNNNQYYRYWRAEADVKFEPGIPFLTGIGFYGFGGGAFYNMKANLVTRAAPQVGFKYVFEPKKSSLGFVANATIATLPKFETFNSDVALLAQFNASTSGLTKIGFTGDFWLAAKLDERAASKIKGGLAVEYNFADKIFYTAALLSVNVPPAITTPAPIGFVMNINGTTNKWYFKSGTPTATNNVNVFGISLYSYLMFGNDIPAPTGFTPRFINNYYAATGSAPNNGNVGAGGVGTNTATGKGIATGIGIEFSKSISKDLYTGLCRTWSIGGTVLAGAELNLALMQQTGCIGINGYRASGNIGLYGSVAATITGTSSSSLCDTKSINLFSIKTGAWLQGKFPNPEYAAGALTADIDLFDGLCQVSYNQSFELGTNCSGTEVVTADAAQEDEAGDLRNKLIQSVAPNSRYNFPVQSPLNVKYALVPDRIFDVSENQGDGTIKNRTFKLVVTRTLEVKNTNGTWLAQTTNSKINNLGEYQYYKKLPLVLTVSSIQMAPALVPAVNTNNGNTLMSANGAFNSNVIVSPVPPPPPPSYPNPVPDAVNTLEIDKEYRFKVTATLMEYGLNPVTGLNAGRGTGTALSWAAAKTRAGLVVTETKTVLFRTGPMPMAQANSSAPRAR